MKIWLNTHKGHLKKILAAIVFMCLALVIFCAATYLLRANIYDYFDRINVVGIQQQYEESLDMVYIGGSAAFVYWEPLRAWSEYGFTSYDLATNTLQAESVLSYVKLAQKYQNPTLYVIDARPFQYYSQDGNETGLRISSDAMDLGVERASLITRYLKNHTLNTDIVSLYLDIAKYHTNIEALAKPTAWELIDNRGESSTKGAGIQARYYYFEENVDFQTEERIALPLGSEERLRELLSYCSENRLNVLLIVCPYRISKEHYAMYNTMQDIASEYAIPFLNMNDYYQQMQFDFSQDLYNSDHVNVLGAEKYTDYLGEYFSKNYQLPDHRLDEAYADWPELAAEYVVVENQAEKVVQSEIQQAKSGQFLWDTIASESNFLVWSSLIHDSAYTVISVGQTAQLSYANFASRNKLVGLGVDDITVNGVQIAAVTGGNSLMKCSGENAQLTSFNIGRNGSSLCSISCTNEEISIEIRNSDSEMRKTFPADQLNIVVFDNTYRQIVDVVALACMEDGTVIIERD